MKIAGKLPWLTYGGALEIVVKRYQRWGRVLQPREVEAELSFEAQTTQ